MALSCSQAKSWVTAHYERHEDGVVAKSVMYKHYEDVCRAENRNIMETSIFGRVVKSVFPDVTIRRLGGRDNLKYYYCGIQAKENSPYANDNKTTTRPKRRLRKRELVTDKVDVHSCLRWLHEKYVASNDSSVVKTDVYDRYVKTCRAHGTEPLSIQYFGMVITHAFPSVTKRKLGPRSNQQKFYFGIEERQNRFNVDFTIPDYYASIIEAAKSYRDSEYDYEDEEFTCQSPESDMSDIGYQNSHILGLHHLPIDESEISHSANLNSLSHMFKQECEEPVDYSLSSLRLKDEPIDFITSVKNEPVDNVHNVDAIDTVSSNQPEFSPSKCAGARKIYKPRFHYNEQPEWKEEPCSKTPEVEMHLDNLKLDEAGLKNWLYHHFEQLTGSHVDRGMVYQLYELYCKNAKETIFPLVFFDETVLKMFSGVVTMIHPSGKTFYEGLKVRDASPFRGCVQELNKIDLKEDGDNQMYNANSMELSPEEVVMSQSSPSSIDEEEPPELIEFPFEEEITDTNSEILRDGKYYLRNWLKEHFCVLPDSCVLKADAYKHYESYCRNMNLVPFEMNVFGKIVRQVFPEVSIRRLGGRMKPQYHYCGIAVKSDSPLIQFMSGKDPAQRSRKKEVATDSRSAEIVIDFLRRNYEFGKHKITMKSEVFDSYVLFCESVNEHPITLNYFGKLVKHCFPNVEVRKFGGRSDPVWYYFGLTPKSAYPNVTKVSNSLNKYGQIVHPENDYQTCLPINLRQESPLFNSEQHPNINRHSTSPIPISLHRSHIHALSQHLSADGSPSSLLNSHLQASLRVSSYDDQIHQNSPAELSHFFPESMSHHSPIEAFYPRSPIELNLKNQGYPLLQVDGSQSKEGFRPYTTKPHIGSGQVVPSQTPPNLVFVPQVEDNMGTPRSNNQIRSSSNQEEYGIFNDMVIE